MGDDVAELEPAGGGEAGQHRRSAGGSTSRSSCRAAPSRRAARSRAARSRLPRARCRPRSPSRPAAARPRPGGWWRGSRRPRRRGRRRRASRRARRRRGRGSARVDGLGRAPASRELELGRVAVDRDDLPRADQPRGGDDLQPDPPAADHAHRLAGPRPGGVAHRADAGHHPAAEQRRLPQRELRRQRHRRRRRDDAVRREARHEVEVLQRPAVGEREPRAAVEQRAGPRVRGGRLAQVEAPGGAGAARAAARHEAERDPVALRDAGDAPPRPPRRHPRPRGPARSAGARARARRRPAGRRCGRRRRRRRGRAPRPPAAPRARRRSTDSGVPASCRTAALMCINATRCASSASRSGSTPRPGPGGGAIVPSAAISSGRGSSQSRRAGVHAGGSSGTST